MKNNSSRSGNVGIQVVAAILSVVAIILGIVAIQAGNSSKQAAQDIQDRLNAEKESMAQVESDIRTLREQMATSLRTLGMEIAGVREEMAKKVETKKSGKAKAGASDEEAAATPSDGSTHTIASGDTIGKLAKKYGTTSDAIMSLNANVDARRLKIGQKLRVK